jgi:hypothetical protein
MEPSIFARVWDFAVVLLVNWKGAVATACLIMLSGPQLLPESAFNKLNSWKSFEHRRKILVALVFASLLFASFEAYDDVSARNRALLIAQNPFRRNITEVNVSPYRAQLSDDVLNVTILPATIILPSNLPNGKLIIVKDKKGQSNAHPIKVTSEEGKIDSLSDYYIVVNHSSVSFIWDGKEWAIY